MASPGGAGRNHRLRGEVLGALQQVVEAEDVQQDVRGLLQQVQLRAAGHVGGDTRHVPLLRHHDQPSRQAQVPVECIRGWRHSSLCVCWLRFSAVVCLPSSFVISLQLMVILEASDGGSCPIADGGVPWSVCSMQQGKVGINHLELVGAMLHLT